MTELVKSLLSGEDFRLESPNMDFCIEFYPTMKPMHSRGALISPIDGENLTVIFSICNLKLILLNLGQISIWSGAESSIPIAELLYSVIRMGLAVILSDQHGQGKISVSTSTKILRGMRTIGGHHISNFGTVCAILGEISSQVCVRSFVVFSRYYVTLILLVWIQKDVFGNFGYFWSCKHIDSFPTEIVIRIFNNESWKFFSFISKLYYHRSQNW